MTQPHTLPIEREMTLTPIDTPEQGLALVVERLAANPSVDVVKLEKIIELQERMLRQQAKADFDACYSKMQPEIPEITEHGQIMVRGALRSTYAKLEDINAVIKPILARHGFAMRHRTEWPADKKDIIRVVGILSHERGHSEESIFEAPQDTSEYRTAIQSMGSTVSYGRRYTTCDLLNIVTRGVDKDGQAQEKPSAPAPPAGFQDWWEDLQTVAENGSSALKAAWEQSSQTFRKHLVNTNNGGWETVKRAAAQVKAGA